MDLPPHFTPAEVAEGLEALMTEPRATWKPALLKAWVRRVRSDAVRLAEREASGRDAVAVSAAGNGDAAGPIFAKIRALVQTSARVAGQNPRPFIRRTDVELLGERTLRAYDAIGGADRFLDPDEKVGFVLRDFERAYRTAASDPVTGVAP